jgi:hypothetical protein
MLDQILDFVTNHLGASVFVVGGILDWAFRLFPTSKPMSVLLAVIDGLKKGADGLKKVVDILVKVLEYLDKVLPQNIKK